MPLSASEVARTALAVQGRLLEAMVEAQSPGGLRKALTTALDHEVVDAVKAIAPPLVIELGAHEAWFSSTIKTALPDVRALAFEANPDVYARYRRPAAAAGVEYVNTAVSDRAGTTTLTIPRKPDASLRQRMGSLLRRQDSPAEQTVAVATVRLDDYLGDDADRASALWIDVEGAIGMVLRGAERTLARCELVYAELEPCQVWQGQMIDTEVFDFLARFGLVPVLRDVQRKRRGYNALFVRADRLKDEALLAAVDRYAATLTVRHEPTTAAPPAAEHRSQGRRRSPEP